jgi:hypothetical protein
MAPVGFELTFSTCERRQTDTDHVASGTGRCAHRTQNYKPYFSRGTQPQLETATPLSAGLKPLHQTVCPSTLRGCVQWEKYLKPVVAIELFRTHDHCHVTQWAVSLFV